MSNQQEPKTVEQLTREELAVYVAARQAVALYTNGLYAALLGACKQETEDNRLIADTLTRLLARDLQVN